MGKIFTAFAVLALLGCAADAGRPAPNAGTLLASDTATEITIPGRADVFPIDLITTPQSNVIIAHTYGDAINLDTIPHNLTVELQHIVPSPDYDAVFQYDTIPANDAVYHFDFTATSNVVAGQSFEEMVIFGSNVENLIVVQNVRLDLIGN